MIEKVLVTVRKVILVIERFWFSRRKVSATLFDAQRPNISTHFTRIFVLWWPNNFLHLTNILIINLNIPQVEDVNYLWCGSYGHIVSKSKMLD